MARQKRSLPAYPRPSSRWPELRVGEVWRLPLPPYGKARPNFDPKRGRAYMPERYTHWIASARAWLATCWVSAPLEGPLTLDFYMVTRRPKGPPPGLSAATWREGAREWTLVTPDTDNGVGAFMDALNPAGHWRGVYADDKQVVHHQCWRAYAAAGEDPCCEVLIRLAPARPPAGLGQPAAQPRLFGIH